MDPEDETVEIYLNKDGRFTLHQQVRRQGVVTSALLDGLKIEVAELLEQML